MVEIRLSSMCRHVEIRSIDYVVRRVNLMEGSQITRVRGRPKKL
jgi:hypothetical protein